MYTWQSTYFCSSVSQWVVFDMWQYKEQVKIYTISSPFQFFLFFLRSSWLICLRWSCNIMVDDLNQAKVCCRVMHGHALQLCRFVHQPCIPNPLMVWQNTAASMVQWAVRISNAAKPISSELKLGRPILCSHIQNSNQISSHSSGIDATLHLTLKWDGL